MAHERLRDCQEHVATTIVEDVVAHLQSDHQGAERRFGFIGVTGSGKTITTSMIIKRVSQRMSGKVLFIYLTLGKGGLNDQVMEKMEGYRGGWSAIGLWCTVFIAIIDVSVVMGYVVLHHLVR
jgi:type III restriction/modification enzyme restriction subunit